MKIGQRNDLPARAAKRIVATIFARSSFKADDPKYDPRAEALNKPVRQYLEDDFSRLIWEEMLVAEGERFETFVEAAFCVASAVVLERLEKFGVDSGVFWGGEQCWGWLDNLSVNQLRIGPDYLSALELVTDAVFTKPTVQLLYRSIELFSRHPVLPFRSFRSQYGKSKGKPHLKADHEYPRGARLPLWHGWDAARRGLGSNLYRLGVPPIVIQRILRHSNVSTTAYYYIKTAADDVRNAMAKLEKTVTENPGSEHRDTLGTLKPILGALPESIN